MSFAWALSSSTSQFDHRNLPLRKRASGLASQTLKLAGRETIKVRVTILDLAGHGKVLTII
jgi:hypothetical protein